MKDRVWLTRVDNKEYWSSQRRNPKAICYVPASELSQVEDTNIRLRAALRQIERGITSDGCFMLGEDMQKIAREALG